MRRTAAPAHRRQHPGWRPAAVGKARAARQAASSARSAAVVAGPPEARKPAPRPPACAAEHRARAEGWRKPAWPRHATAHEHDIRDTHAAHRAPGAAGFRAGDIDAWAAMEAEPGGTPLPRQRSADARAGLGRDGTHPRTMGAARLRLLRAGTPDRWRLRRHTPACCIRRNGLSRSWPTRSHREFWGQGLAAEAVRAARDWAFASTASPGSPASSCRTTSARSASPKTWGGARGHGGDARLSGAMVGASAADQGSPDMPVCSSADDTLAGARAARGRPVGPVLLTADHAGRAIPRGLGRLGLPERELDRHIAWDIGIAGVTERLSATLDATAVLQTYSRLVIDCNRDPSVPSSIPEVSETTAIPGNLGLSADRARGAAAGDFRAVSCTHRARCWMRARRPARRTVLRRDAQLHAGVQRRIARPMQVGVLYNRDVRLAEIMLELLRARGRSRGRRQRALRGQRRHRLRRAGARASSAAWHMSRSRSART